MKKSFIFLISVLLSYSVSGQVDILDARTNFNIDQSVTVTGIVTNGQGLGSVRYIQDESAGIAIYPGTDWSNWTFEPEPGDEITVSGVLSEFNGLLEVGPDLSAVDLITEGNELPTPLEITPDQMNESLEGQLVTILNCIFDNGGSEIQENATYSFSASLEDGVAYFRVGNPLVGETLPVSPVTLIGIASQFSFDGFGGYQLLPRDLNDFILDSGINLISTVEQDDIEQDGFALSWLTDTPGNTIVEYGLTSDLGNMEMIEESATDHNITLTGLNPGEIYYVKASSSNGDETAESGVSPYATVSESSGDIIPYFTGSVDVGFATIEEAISLGSDMNDTIAAYIDRSVETLDIAMYNISDQTIVNAINDAWDRGVEVRYIAQGTNLNSGIDQFDTDIPVLYREDDNGSGMHNKFFIVDVNDVHNSWVMGGSTNWTGGNLQDDFNNVVFIQDQSLAKGYELEFEEMWGGDDVMPNIFESAFSSEKSVNTPRKFIVGGSLVEVFFSPTDNTNLNISEFILSANTSLQFATLAFTRDDLGEAVIDRHNDFFVNVEGIIEQTSDNGSEYQTLIDNGVQVTSHEGIPGSLHHKYGIVDQDNVDSDPAVLTGSHNWSSSAENVNDENVMIIHDARIANIFYQEFAARFGLVSVIEEAEISAEIYPNPTEGIVNIRLSNSERFSVEIFDMSGRLVFSECFVGGSAVCDLSDLNSGVYSLNLRSKKTQFSNTLLIR